MTNSMGFVGSQALAVFQGEKIAALETKDKHEKWISSRGLLRQ